MTPVVKKVRENLINIDKNEMLRLKNTISSEEHFQGKNESNDAKPHSIYKFSSELS